MSQGRSDANDGKRREEGGGEVGFKRDVGSAQQSASVIGSTLNS